MTFGSNYQLSEFPEETAAAVLHSCLLLLSNCKKVGIGIDKNRRPPLLRLRRLPLIRYSVLPKKGGTIFATTAIAPDGFSGSKRAFKRRLTQRRI